MNVINFECKNVVLCYNNDISNCSNLEKNLVKKST